MSEHSAVRSLREVLARRDNAAAHGDPLVWFDTAVVVEVRDFLAALPGILQQAKLDGFVEGRNDLMQKFQNLIDFPEGESYREESMLQQAKAEAWDEGEHEGFYAGARERPPESLPSSGC